MKMKDAETIVLSRNVRATRIPSGESALLNSGETAHITQELGGSYTILLGGNLFRIEHKDGDALGREIEDHKDHKDGKDRNDRNDHKDMITSSKRVLPRSEKEIETEIWNQLKTCYDPEIPVNIVDLGLIYDCVLRPETSEKGGRQVDVKMTLTAPGCGMGPMIAQDVQNKLMCIEEVEKANVELVWDPQWNQSMMSEAAQLQLGLM